MENTETKLRELEERINRAVESAYAMLPFTPTLSVYLCEQDYNLLNSEEGVVISRVHTPKGISSVYKSEGTDYSFVIVRSKRNVGKDTIMPLTVIV